jgi:hypothetical protein
MEIEPGSKDDMPPKLIDVYEDTLMLAIVYRDGTVDIKSEQPPAWIAKALRHLAEHVEGTAHRDN